MRKNHHLSNEEYYVYEISSNCSTSSHEGCHSAAATEAEARLSQRQDRGGGFRRLSHPRGMIGSWHLPAGWRVADWQIGRERLDIPCPLLVVRLMAVGVWAGDLQGKGSFTSLRYERD